MTLAQAANTKPFSVAHYSDLLGPSWLRGHELEVIIPEEVIHLEPFVGVCASIDVHVIIVIGRCAKLYIGREHQACEQWTSKAWCAKCVTRKVVEKGLGELVQKSTIKVEALET